MTDITHDIRVAMGMGSVDEDRTHKLLSLIARYSGGSVQWERGDEQWGVVSNAEGVIAMVAVFLPLVVMFGFPEPPLHGESVHIIAAENWYYIGNRVDRDVMEKALGAPISSNVLDLNDFSFHTLWYATVS